MATTVRRAGIGALVLAGLLAGQNAAQAQFAFGMTRYGFNPSNPFIAQQQFMSNLGANAMAIRFGGAGPRGAAVRRGGRGLLAGRGIRRGVRRLQSVPGRRRPRLRRLRGDQPLPGRHGANIYASGGSSYGGSGGSNPYLSSYAYGGGGYGFSNPAVGPGITLMGTADVMRAYGTVITSQEQARTMREQYYQEKLKTRRQKFDLEMYIKANTPTFQEQQEKIAKLQLRRIQNTPSLAEVRDGRALNALLDDIARQPNKTPVSEAALDTDTLKQLNIQPSARGNSLGMLRNGGELNWPVALVKDLPPDMRKDMSARAQALAQAALTGKRPDPNAIADLDTQIERADTQLKKKANDFSTPDYMAAGRFLTDLRNAVRAISRGEAKVQVQFDRMVTNGEIKNVADLVKVMNTRGWRFAPALPSEEGAYQALYSALVSYDVALNQMVATTEP